MITICETRYTRLGLDKHVVREKTIRFFGWVIYRWQECSASEQPQ